MASKDNLQGITIGGKDLAEHLYKKGGDELLNEMVKQHYTKKGSRVKYMDHKERHSEVKRESQHNLNIINLDGNLQKSKTNYERVIAYLITGKTIDSKFVKATFGATDASAILRNIYDSNLGEHIERESTGTKLLHYTLNSIGCNLTFQGACDLYKSRPLKTPKTATRSDLPVKVPDKAPSPSYDAPALKIPKNININITLRIVFGLERG